MLISILTTTTRASLLSSQELCLSLALKTVKNACVWRWSYSFSYQFIHSRITVMFCFFGVWGVFIYIVAVVVFTCLRASLLSGYLVICMTYLLGGLTFFPFWRLLNAWKKYGQAIRIMEMIWYNNVMCSIHSYLVELVIKCTHCVHYFLFVSCTLLISHANLYLM